MKYDVFISKNSADQAIANAIVRFLESSGLSVFESNKDLPLLGDSDYSKAIFEALDNSKNIIIVCSPHENGSNSRWVYDEWSTFINEIRSMRRTGQVLTIRNGIGIEQLDPQLRKYESFEFNSFESRILPYLGKTVQVKNYCEPVVKPTSNISFQPHERQDRIPDMPKANGYGFVDLGLSVKWATHNIGAKTPEECGHYFTWGDPKPILGNKHIGWENYKFSSYEKGTYPQYFDIKFNKYVITKERGVIDHLSQLDSVDDPATAIWGGSWRTPSMEEIKELLEKCNWQWTDIHGQKGFRIISRINQNSIFLPAAGYLEFGSTNYRKNEEGDYWTRSLHNNSTSAHTLFFKENEHICGHVHRCYCNSIRPVLD